MVARSVALATLRLLAPPLAPTSYKGSSGKVGVLGGCFEYTGAPFYAALSALKLGADLSHVFCDEQAAVPIKSYSPELIVHGCLRSVDNVDADEIKRQADEVIKWFPALTALVIGPGLGRDETMQAVAAQVVQRAVESSLPMVIDADGLRVVLDNPDLVRGAKWVVLTPNRPEYGRMLDAEGAASADDPNGERVPSMAQSMGGLTIVRKGPTDVISDGTLTLECDEPGCLKRCGGQGDVLAGSIATLLGWAKAAEKAKRLPEGESPPLLAAFAGCLLTRRFAASAFAKHKRSMTAPDLIDSIGETFEAFSPADEIRGPGENSKPSYVT